MISVATLAAMIRTPDLSDSSSLIVTPQSHGVRPRVYGQASVLPLVPRPSKALADERLKGAKRDKKIGRISNRYFIFCFIIICYHILLKSLVFRGHNKQKHIIDELGNNWLILLTKTLMCAIINVRLIICN